MFPIAQSVIRIGRVPGNDLQLSGEKVSRRHVRIERDPGGLYRVTDLGSTNGTWLGDKRLTANQPEVWQPGETLRIGQFWLQLEAAARYDATRAYSAAGPGGRPLR
ncbi:MAG: FHA domain-containing protein [Anaerolineae bacterium]|nr:FHA domain-containing protein [Anaerolineae bacterium]